MVLLIMLVFSGFSFKIVWELLVKANVKMSLLVSIPKKHFRNVNSYRGGSSTPIL